MLTRMRLKWLLNAPATISPTHELYRLAPENYINHIQCSSVDDEVHTFLIPWEYKFRIRRVLLSGAKLLGQLSWEAVICYWKLDVRCWSFVCLAND